MGTKIGFVIALALVAGCSSSSTTAPTDADRRAALPQAMHDSLQTDLASLIASAKALQAAAPSGAAGWDPVADAAAITSMKAAWRNCRIAYEHTEGALAPIFPDLDASLDARYDDFLATLGTNGDANLFDDQGVTGMHAIERILFADQIADRVVAFESTLPGYVKAAFPATADEATSFKTKLLQKLIDDAQKLSDQWQPAAIDIGVAFQGLVSLMNEQREKVNKAATGEEESRYAQTTLFDLRNNLEGTSKIYALFQPWLQTKTSSDPTADGPTIDAKIESGFTLLSSDYGPAASGDAIPQPPATWSSDAPTPTDLTTPFGKIWSSVQSAVDPTTAGSVVAQMNDAATVLGFPQFVEGE